MTLRILALATITAGVLAMAAPVQVEQWRRAEMVLTSDRDYANPFAEVRVRAIFRNGETTITRPAFWDGERTWRVRFAPPSTGEWQWETTCSDAQNTGLHAQQDTLTCAPYRGDNPNYTHGPVQISPNRRYFVRADGTPFFWLGDTHWQMPDRERIHENNAPDAKGRSQFTQLAEDRLAKGFTVYQNYFNGHSGHWWRDREYACIDPTRFREVMDPMLDELAERGFVIAQGIGLYITAVRVPRASMERLAEYVAARYGAHPLVWITGQEVNLPSPKDGPPRTDLAVWAAAAETFAKTNGYGHPVGGHMYPGKPTVWGQEPWHDWFPLQGGHTGSGIRKLNNFLFYWDHTPRKPFLETEAMYEAIKCGPRVADASDVRHSAWKSLLCGSYGYTYGGAAVWLMRWDHKDGTGKSYNPNHCWYEGMRLPGSSQMTHLRHFFAKQEWWKLVPRFADPAWSEFRDRERTVVASEGNRVYVVYAYGLWRQLGRLHGLARNQPYAAWWFDPRTGTRHPIASDITSDDGSWMLPNKPSGDDWVLLLRQGRATAEEMAGDPAPEQAIDAKGNVALFAHTTASATDTANGYAPEQAVDGLADHSWNGWSAAAGEYLEVTFEEPVTISRIVMHTKQDYEMREYAIELRRQDRWETVLKTKDNTKVQREHALAATGIQAIRLRGLRGPDRQPGIVRVNELQVFRD